MNARARDTALLEFNGVSYSYNGARALDGVSFSVGRGELLSVFGPNGSGKSTLLRLACGALKPATGAITAGGRPLEGLTPREQSSLAAYVPSEPYIPFDFTTLDIALMGRSPLLCWWRDYGPADRAAALRALESCGIAPLAGRGINSVSSGERQLAFLAQALAGGAPLLLLDEPTSHLDLKYRSAFFETLATLRAGGLSAIVVSHDLRLAASYSTSAVILAGGKVLFNGPASDAVRPGLLAEAYGIPPEAAARLA
ncbi:MAG: iron complex transport system ATP-binding protein [Elusimicrobia bacterium]|nr:MAG: iron complex transport system ATP-binding protein [Elusimicrobiota bacterium]KAF0154574.1 MAG: iron complex transport system ATP-binding protein [Elusimicrobiota bacterium]